MDKSIHIQRTNTGWMAFFNDETTSLWYPTAFTKHASTQEVTNHLKHLNPEYQIKVIKENMS